MQKAIADEEEQIWYSQKLKNYRNKTDDQHVHDIQESLNYLNSFLRSDPALTKHQWFNIEQAMYMLEKTMGVEKRSK